MISFVNTIDIEREPADVFAYLSDLEHTPEWNWAITETRMITPGPTSVGSRYEQTRSVPRPGVETIEITNLEPNRRIGVAGTLGPFEARLSYELVPTDVGTRLRNTVELEPSGPLRIVAGVLGGRIRASVAENLGVLKTVLEARQPGDLEGRQPAD